MGIRKTVKINIRIDQIEAELGEPAAALSLYLYAHKGERSGVFYSSLKHRDYTPSIMMDSAEARYGNYLDQLPDSDHVVSLAIGDGHIQVRCYITDARVVRLKVIEQLCDLERNILENEARRQSLAG